MQLFLQKLSNGCRHAWAHEFFWKNWWPVGVLVGIEIVVFLSNWLPGTWLLGWDNTVPELNFPLNLARIFSSMWQEYRGLGTLDGMAHGANVSYWLLTWVLHLVVPTEIVRYVSNLFLHLVGGIGMYVLCQAVFAESSVAPRVKQWMSFATAMVLLFNLYTIQIFYFPLETFTVHFAAWPWLIFSIVRFLRLKKPTPHAALVVFLTHLLFSSQAHVPTVFVSYVLGCSLLLVGWLLTANAEQYVERIKKVSAVIGLIFAANAFWGLPYIYSALAKAPEITASKQYRFGSPSIIYRNSGWSDLRSVTTFGGFSLKYEDYDQNTHVFKPAMERWLVLWSSPVYQGGAVVLFGIALLGWVRLSWMVIYKRTPLAVGVLLASTASFMALATNLPVLAQLWQWLTQHIPFFEQIFRFKFTKFSLMYGFFFSLCVAFALEWIAQKRWKKFALPPIAVAVTIVLFTQIPAVLLSWHGFFFYPALHVHVPDEYFSAAQFMNQQLHASRVVFLPIHSFWGWITNTNRWGYRGSGFVWQMMKQPLVDRAFDQWSAYNETVFLQLNEAVYRSNATTLQQLLESYHIGWLLLDTSIFNPGNWPEDTNFDGLTLLIQQLSHAQHAFHQGAISLWKANDTTLQPFAPPQLAEVHPKYVHLYTRFDQALKDFGSYILRKTTHTSAQAVVYPYSYLQREELSVLGHIRNDTYRLPLHIPKEQQLLFPQLDVVLTQIAASKTDDAVTLYITPQLPEVLEENTSATNRTEQLTINLRTLPPAARDDMILLINHTIATQLTPTTLTNTPRPLTSVMAKPGSTLSLQFFQAAPHTSLPLRTARNMPCTSAMLLTGQTDTCLTFQYAPTPTQDLLALAFSYRTSTERAPELCVESEEGCINQFLRESVGPQTAWSRITQLMPLEGKRPQSIALLSDSENNPSPPDPAIHVSLVQYKDVVATQHTFLMERVATLPESTVENWPTILDEASRRGSSLELAFPLGPNSMMTQRNIWLENLSSPVTNCRSGQEGQTGSVQKTVRDTAAEYASQGHAIACTSLTYRDLSDVWGYVLHVVGQSLEGAGLHYTLLNPTTKRFDAEYTSGEHSIERYHPFLPSTHPIRKGSTVYTFTLTLESLSGETNRAIVDQVELIPLPLAWLRQIRTTVVDTKNDMQIAARMNNPTVVSNTSSWLTFVHSAVVDVHDTQGTQDTQNARGLVVLPQSFDQGWLGIPLYRWWEGSEHVIWNGWANGWLLPKGQGILVMVYWPQLLAYLGMAVGAGVGVMLVKKMMKVRTEKVSK